MTSLCAPMCSRVRLREMYMYTQTDANQCASETPTELKCVCVCSITSRRCVYVVYCIQNANPPCTFQHGSITGSRAGLTMMLMMMMVFLLCSIVC